MPPAFFVSGAGTTFGLSYLLTSLPGEGPSAAVKEVEMEIVPDGAKEQEKQDCCSNSAQYHEDLHHIYEEEGRLLFRVLLLFRSCLRIIEGRFFFGIFLKLQGYGAQRMSTIGVLDYRSLIGLSGLVNDIGIQVRQS